MTDMTVRVHDRDLWTTSGWIKRGIDIAGALFILGVATPAFLLLTALIASTGGPVFFRQHRVGRDGITFECLKFRTMHPGAEGAIAALIAHDGRAAHEWAQCQKLPVDPRVTPLGRILRRWGIDELPQLINVLRGEMSLVGPRPIIAPDMPGYPADRAYANSAAFQAYIQVRPGITGLWQVSGGSDLPYRHRVALDQRYVRFRSLWLDLWILWTTPLALIRRRSS